MALQLREEALREWAIAESLHEVRAAWARLGGRIPEGYDEAEFSDIPF